jgi:6-phosphogluconolactonase/glucosamine-6-phosphate isomerase/deaminase
MLQFVTIQSVEPVVEALVTKLSSSLAAGKKTLWLVPGGSSIAIAIAVAKRLADYDLRNLSVMLTDERYGATGHADSNWHQLLDGGFALSGATLVPVLTDKDQATTTAEFAAHLQALLDTAEYSLGFFGIGADGHTAGMLPGTSAVESTEYAAGYDAGNFQRITMTSPAIARLNEAVVYAVGESKWPVFDGLEQDITIATMPAQALKQVPTVTIFNDYKGESA